MVRFLWDAHNCEEAREEEELVVSTPYIEHWNDLIDLWYLGMQVPRWFSDLYLEFLTVQCNELRLLLGQGIPFTLTISVMC